MYDGAIGLIVCSKRINNRINRVFSTSSRIRRVIMLDERVFDEKSCIIGRYLF